MKYHNYCSLLFYYATSVPLVQKIVSIYKLYKVSNTLKLTTQKLSNHNLTHLLVNIVKQYNSYLYHERSLYIRLTLNQQEGLYQLEELLFQTKFQWDDESNSKYI